MASAGTQGLIIATIFMGLFLQYFPSQAEAVLALKFQAIINNVCKREYLEDPRFCYDSFLSNPRISSASNLRDVADLAMESAKKESNRMGVLFDVLANSRHASSKCKEALKACADSYKTSLIFFSLRGLQGGTASLDVHYAYDQSVMCDNILAEAGVQIKSVSAAIQKWKKVYSVAYATVLALEN